MPTRRQPERRLQRYRAARCPPGSWSLAQIVRRSLPSIVEITDGRPLGLLSTAANASAVAMAD